MAVRLLPAIQQVFSNIGEIGTGFKLKTYATLTVTPLATYSNEALSTPNANPATGATTGNQIADGNGRFGDMWVDTLSSYKIILTDEDDVTIDTVDPVDGSMAAGGGLTQFDPIPEAFWGTTAGTSSAYTLASNVDISTVGYQDTQIFQLAFHTTCAINPTIAIDGLSALNLKKYTGQGTKVGLQVGDVGAQTYIARNDGVDIIILNPTSSAIYSGVPPTLTLVSDTATITNVGGTYIIDTEGAAASDNLATINGGANGQIIFLRIANSARVVTLTSAGNIFDQSGISLPLVDTGDIVQLRYDSVLGKWVLISYSAKGSYSTNGYRRNPDGSIEQWGQANAGATSGSTSTVTYPIAFPTATRNVNTQFIGSSGTFGSVSSIVLDGAPSTTGFSTIRGNVGNSDSFVLFMWKAEGN